MGTAIAAFPVALYLLVPNVHMAAFAWACAAVSLAAALASTIQSLRYLGTLA